MPLCHVAFVRRDLQRAPTLPSMGRVGPKGRGGVKPRAPAYEGAWGLTPSRRYAATPGTSPGAGSPPSRGRWEQTPNALQECPPFYSGRGRGKGGGPAGAAITAAAGIGSASGISPSAACEPVLAA